jgi:dTMP kinase
MLIVIEGADGTGKNTQRKLLVDRLSKRGLEVKYHHYPDYDYDYGKMIRSYLDRAREMSVGELLLVYLVDMIKDKSKIAQELDEGNIVILDRYFFSTVAYQSTGGFEYEKAKKIVKLLDLKMPDVVFYLNVPVEISMERKDKQRMLEENRKGDRHEADKSLHRNIRKYYKMMIKEGFGSKKWFVIDAARKPKEVHASIMKALDPMLDKAHAVRKIA